MPSACALFNKGLLLWVIANLFLLYSVESHKIHNEVAALSFMNDIGEPKLPVTEIQKNSKRREKVVTTEDKLKMLRDAFAGLGFIHPTSEGLKVGQTPKTESTVNPKDVETEPPDAGNVDAAVSTPVEAESSIEQTPSITYVGAVAPDTQHILSEHLAETPASEPSHEYIEYRDLSVQIEEAPAGEPDASEDEDGDSGIQPVGSPGDDERLELISEPEDDYRLEPVGEPKVKAESVPIGEPEVEKDQPEPVGEPEVVVEVELAGESEVAVELASVIVPEVEETRKPVGEPGIATKLEPEDGSLEVDIKIHSEPSSRTMEDELLLSEATESKTAKATTPESETEVGNPYTKTDEIISRKQLGSSVQVNDSKKHLSGPVKVAAISVAGVCVAVVIISNILGIYYSKKGSEHHSDPEGQRFSLLDYDLEQEL